MMKTENDNPIEFLQLNEGQSWSLEPGANKIILVMEGKIELRSSNHPEICLTSSNMVFYPFQERVVLKATRKTKVVLLRFSNQSSLCNVVTPFDKKDDNSIILPLKDVIFNYIQILEKYIKKGIDSDFLLELKLKEFGYILKHFYSEEQLQSFFNLLPGNDSLFTEEVYSLSLSVRSVRQLAERMNYSYSGFNKRFRRVFNMSAYSWMRNQRAKQVYQDICQTSKSLKEISTNHKFATLSHFNEFCHKNLGNSPSEIRRKNRTRQYI
ncbi:AraC family transcriptional regulator [Dysgonomonas sp. 520]|uniref:helix-turn-helix domain-containing protein n=1 Tax=Dysgonomonas sp. 520 TaxID=2302931 RepID=UPI0013D15FE8|nr:helix-turn-helix transcriptional regulator [Dysgonomonas sp. 520]NDW11254.1 AraC family transcriptional regulator [Dysgonomonas sp. 520]